MYMSSIIKTRIWNTQISCRFGLCSLGQVYKRAGIWFWLCNVSSPWALLHTNKDMCTGGEGQTHLTWLLLNKCMCKHWLVRLFSFLNNSIKNQFLCLIQQSDVHNDLIFYFLAVSLTFNGGAISPSPNYLILGLMLWNWWSPFHMC